MAEDAETGDLLRYLDGTLPPRDAERLSERLRDDPALRRRLAGIAMQSVMLQEIGEEARAAAPSRRRLPAVAAAAAAVAAAVATAWLAARPPPIGTVASATAAGDAPGPPPAILRGPARLPMVPGAAVRAGDRLETGHAAVRIEYRGEPTALEAGPGTALSLGSDRGVKLVRLDCGELAARIASQPAGRPMRFATPHAVAEVLGTRLRLAAGARATLLEVEEGRVRLTRSCDGASADVPAGCAAVAAAGAPLEVLRRPEDPKALRQAVREGAVPGERRAGADERELEALFDRKIEGLETPPRKLCYVYKSELTPAVAVLSRSSTVTVFNRIKDYGLSGPTACAWASGGQIRTAGRQEISGLDESWMLFWFAGGAGWEGLRYSEYAKRLIKDERSFTFDVPFLVSLQRKPRRVAVGENGVELAFPGEAGLVQIMPLLGVDRPAPATTSKWKDGLPPEIVRLAREWNARLKFMPVQVREDYAVDAARDSVDITYSYRFVAVRDEWGTAGSQDAPLPPVVALAAEHGFPLRFSPQPRDTRCPTHFGPLWVAPGASSVTVSVPGIASLATRVPVPRVDRSRDTDLLEKIEREALQGLDDPGAGWWAGASIALKQGHKAACIPYVSPQAAEAIKAATMRIVNSEVFDYGRNAARLVDEKRRRIYVVDYYNHFNRFAGDDESPACQFPRGLWSYAFHTGDWYSIRRLWPDIRGAGVGSYVKNNWIIQSRFNSGGDTFHDIILGTCAMARMAAVLGEEKDYGLFTYLLARHLLAYYGFEYALARHAVKYPPWFVPVDDWKPMLVWDIYAPFGGFFTPYDASGFYGTFSGFKEHYARIGEGTGEMADVMARFYRRFLAGHARETFEGVERRMKIDAKDDFWGLIFHLNAVLNDWDHERTRSWLEACPWTGKGNVTVLRTLYDKRHPPREVEVLHPSLRRRVTGRGIDLQVDGEGHMNLDVDTEGRREPALFWFGFNAPGAAVKEGTHGSNTLKFGEIIPGPGKIIARETARPNWVAAVYSFDLGRPSAEQEAAAEEQGRARWLAIGPFGDQRAADKQFDTVFEPERDRISAPDTAREYVGGVKYKEGNAEPPLKVKWREIRLGVKPLGDSGPAVPFAASCRLGFDHFGYQYLYTRVKAPKDMDATVCMGYRGPNRVWVNGQEIYSTRKRTPFKPDGHMFPVRLRKGWNPILIKARCVEFWETFSFAVYDDQEQLIPGLVFDPRGK